MLYWVASVRILQNITVSLICRTIYFYVALITGDFGSSTNASLVSTLYLEVWAYSIHHCEENRR